MSPAGCGSIILIGTDGPFDNVLKIRPPLTIDGDDCEMLLKRLDQVLAEAQLINQADDLQHLSIIAAVSPP